MPNRIIKESIAASERISNLSDFEFRLWVGLITYVDDKGRGDARAPMIRAHVFPLRDDISNSMVERSVQSLVEQGCIVRYEVDGKPYLYFPNWEKHQRVRNVREKYPAPPSFLPSAASCGESRPESESESENESESEAEAESELRTAAETSADAVAPDGASAGAPTPAPLGKYGWVCLTQEELTQLNNEFGEQEVQRCIDYVDESAQSNGNRNHWKDWSVVLRRCHKFGWGLRGNQGNYSPTPGTSAPTSTSTSTSTYTEEQCRKDMERMRWMLSFGKTGENARPEG